MLRPIKAVYQYSCVVLAAQSISTSPDGGGQVPLSHVISHLFFSYMCCNAGIKSWLFYIYASFCNQPISQDRVFLFIQLW